MVTNLVLSLYIESKVDLKILYELIFQPMISSWIVQNNIILMSIKFVVLFIIKSI